MSAIIVDTNTWPQYASGTGNVTVITSNIDDLSAESIFLLQDGTLNVEVDRRWITGMDQQSDDGGGGVRQFWYIS